MSTGFTRTATAIGMVLALAASAVLGCSEDKCTRHSDCAAGYYCSPTGNCEPVVVPDGSGEDVGREDAARDDGRDVEADVEAEAEADAVACSDPEACDDGNPCTSDGCDGDAGVCSHTPISDGTACDDDDPCNGTELGCLAGVCRPGTDVLGEGASCADDMFCNGAEVCSAGGRCVDVAPPCGPMVTNGCRRTGCDEEFDRCGTFAVPDEPVTFCSLASDVCGSPTGACIAGVCQVGPTDLCDDDGNTCTDNYCTPDGDGTNPICTYVPVPNRTPCAPDDMCLGASGRACIAGVCSIGSAPACTDGSLCITTTCSGGTECTVPTPPPPYPALECGGSAAGTTVLSRNDVTGYGSDCTGYFDGGENVWSLRTSPSTTRVELRLTDDLASGTLSLLALGDACNPASCQGVSAADGVLNLSVSGEVTLYVVVDGVGAARGPYSIGATCL